MRARGIAGLRLRRKVRTTIAEPADTPVPDLLERDFTADAPNVKYVGDITYLPFGDGHTTGNLYLATVIDCFSRRLVGWSIAGHMRTELVEDALKAACHERGSLAGAVFHADHGAQYTARDFTMLCEGFGVTRSMGAVGSSADNALAESFNATLKRETLQGAARWATADDARQAVFRWVTRYNTRRRHSWCAQTSPTSYEHAHYAATLQPAANHQSRVHFSGRRPSFLGQDRSLREFTAGDVVGRTALGEQVEVDLTTAAVVERPDPFGAFVSPATELALIREYVADIAIPILVTGMALPESLPPHVDLGDNGKSHERRVADGGWEAAPVRLGPYTAAKMAEAASARATRPRVVHEPAEGDRSGRDDD